MINQTHHQSLYTGTYHVEHKQGGKGAVGVDGVGRDGAAHPQGHVVGLQNDQGVLHRV